MSPPADVTGLLLAWSDGDPAAAAPLMDAVYAELRRIARRHLWRERRGHSVSATALVHDAYVKLVDQRRVEWRNRAQFFAIASRLMRRVLVDRARARQADKRGAGLTVSLDDVRATTSDATPDVVALDLALERLAALDPRQARLVELRFFGGLTFDEAAVVLDVAAITLKRDWALARTWLYRELGGSS